MKLAHDTYTDIGTGTLDEGSFSVNASATMFYVTMSGIAKDKVAYPVREVCTNAWDVARGDFDVYLPSRFDLNFRVRDYGPGLTHDQVKNTYTRMFCSTKDKDNEAAGGLGLGCKSPFAYLMKSDQMGGGGAGSFNVTSYQGGVARFYVMSIANDGRPKWQMLAELPTEERDGLEVSFAVRREDTYRFQDAAQQILWSFEPRPRIHGATWEWPIAEVARKGAGWVAYKASTTPLAPGASVRMGPVAYTVDVNMLGKARAGWPWLYEHILFEAPIGSLSVQSSREQLSYDDRTIGTLKQLLTQFEIEYIQSLQTQVDAFSTYVEAVGAWFYGNTLAPASVRNYLTQRVAYKGRLLRDHFTWPAKALKYNRREFDALVPFQGHIASGMQFIPLGSRQRDTTTITTSHVPSLICYELNTRRSAEKFRAALDAGDLALPAGMGSFGWLRATDAATISEFATTFGLDEKTFINLDSYPLPKLVRGPRGSRPHGPTFIKAVVLRRDANTWVLDSNESRVDVSGGAVYLPIANSGRSRRTWRWQVDWNGNRTHSYDLALNYLQAATTHIPDKQEILLVRNGDLEKVQTQPQCVQADKWLKDLLETKIDFTQTVTLPSKNYTFSLDYQHRIGLELLAKAVNCPRDIVALQELFTKKNTRPADDSATLFAIYQKAGGLKTFAKTEDEDAMLTAMYEAICLKYPELPGLLTILAGAVRAYRPAADEKQTASNIVLYLSLYLAHINASLTAAVAA